MNVFPNHTNTSILSNAGHLNLNTEGHQGITDVDDEAVLDIKVDDTAVDAILIREADLAPGQEAGQNTKHPTERAKAPEGAATQDL